MNLKFRYRDSRFPCHRQAHHSTGRELEIEIPHLWGSIRKLETRDSRLRGNGHYYMIKGVGIDIIEVARIKGIMEKYGDKFFKRILTDNEIAYCKKFSDAELHFAGRFASKEAYSKAIGTGISKDFGWKDIEILNDERGKPYINHVKESEYSKLKFHISISHTKEYGSAVVVCEE